VLAVLTRCVVAPATQQLDPCLTEGPSCYRWSAGQLRPPGPWLRSVRAGPSSKTHMLGAALASLLPAAASTGCSKGVCC
jgi:hypothetical protein